MTCFSRFALGQRVRHTLTGLEGTVVCVTFWMNGCVRPMIQPFGVKDGKPAETYVGDEPDFKSLDALPVQNATATTRTHGGRDDAAATRR